MTNEEKAKTEYDCVFPFNNFGIARVNKNGKISFVNKKYQLITNQWFDDVNSFYNQDPCCDYFYPNGFCEVKLNGKYSLLNINGTLTDDGKTWFDRIYNFGFEEFIANGYLDDKETLIKSDNSLIYKGKIWFDLVKHSSNRNTLFVRIKEKYYRMDKRGKLSLDYGYCSL